MCCYKLISPILIAVVVGISITHCTPGKNNLFQTPSKCANKLNHDKEKCMTQYCDSNRNKFVCKSLKCDSNYEGNNMGKLGCIKTACLSHSSEFACRKLKECEAKKGGLFGGLFSYISCVVNLFS